MSNSVTERPPRLSNRITEILPEYHSNLEIAVLNNRLNESLPD